MAPRSRRPCSPKSRTIGCVFLEGTRADLGVVTTQLTAFTIRARTSRGVDLVATPFDAHSRSIASPSRYEAAQSLGTAMREAGTDSSGFRRREIREGVNVGVFAPSVFGAARPRELETWHCTATRSRVEFTTRDYFKREALVFRASVFSSPASLPCAGRLDEASGATRTAWRSRDRPRRRAAPEASWPEPQHRSASPRPRRTSARRWPRRRIASC